jgi:rod shape-determining protein MreC
MKRYDAGVDYFKLRMLNDSIAEENAFLMSQLYNREKVTDREMPVDSQLLQYNIIPAKIINKTITQRNNRFTINKGTQHGIDRNMGVLSTSGIIGIVHKANERFCSVMPIINTQFQVSAKIKSKNYFGDLIWEPYDERYMQLRHIPKHAAVALGDTVITSGYSSVFPPDIPIGLVDNIRLPAGSNYFDMRVRLFNQLANLEYVYIVDYQLKSIRNEIENDN